MPVSSPVDSNGSTGTSAQEKQAYQPSASRLIVTVLGTHSCASTTGETYRKRVQLIGVKPPDAAGCPLSTYAACFEPPRLTQ